MFQYTTMKTLQRAGFCIRDCFHVICMIPIDAKSWVQRLFWPVLLAPHVWINSIVCRDILKVLFIGQVHVLFQYTTMTTVQRAGFSIQDIFHVICMIPIDAKSWV